jgi:hypothetical protein
LTPSPEKSRLKSRLGEVEVGASLLTPSPKKSRKWVSDHGEDVHKRKKQRLEVEVGASLLTPSLENVRNGMSDDDDRKESDHQKERPPWKSHFDFSTMGLQDPAPEIELGTG